MKMKAMIDFGFGFECWTCRAFKRCAGAGLDALELGQGLGCLHTTCYYFLGTLDCLGRRRKLETSI